MKEVGIKDTIVAAMNQAFFTLSLGIGAMAIFGSYIGKDHALLGESIRIGILDTFVAIVAGLIILPACSAYGISPDQGPSLIFITLPNVSIQWQAVGSGVHYSCCLWLLRLSLQL